MTHCDRGPEPAERYVSGAMLEPERTGFEEHFFGCHPCFRAVQALEDARALLAAQSPALLPALIPTQIKAGRPGIQAAPVTSGRGLPLKWMAVAATLVIIAGMSATLWRVSGPAAVPTQSPTRSEAPAQVPVQAPVAPRPSTAPAPSPAASPAPPSRLDRLERWAIVVPPRYVALTTRSGQGQEEDEATRRFNEAMTEYAAGRYRQAAGGLQILAERAPAAAHVQFFLGISELMAGNVRGARGALQRSAESGVTPYSDEAHFYLAKAALRSGDLTTAARELEIAVEREAGPEGEAAKLLAELRRAVR